VAEWFYPTSMEVLKFDSDKDLDKIRFNHYLARKENLQRINSDLPRGQFYMTINQVSKDLNFTFAKSQRLIKEFEEKSIIKLVFQHEKWEKKPSIWEYVSAAKSDNQNDNQDDSQNDNQEHSKINGSEGVKDNQNDNQADSQSDNPKKDNIKRKYKKEIYSSSEHEQQAEQLWNLYPSKTGKGKVITKMPKLIKEYGYEQIVRCIDRYKLYVDKQRITFQELKYQNGSTFFNSGYVDYLDKNYVETKEIPKETKQVPKYKDFGNSYD
jgi:hypothetical protein